MATIILIVILTSINAFFAASEMAFVSISPATLYQIQESKKKNAKLLAKVMKDSTQYLSTIQVAITFAGFLSSAFAGSQLSGDLVALAASFGLVLSGQAALIIITLILSYFTLVFGELVPKRIALSKAQSIALFSAPIIYFSMKLFSPFVFLLTQSTKAIVALFGINPKRKKNAISEKEIKEMIFYGHIKGLYDQQEKEMMEKIFTFDDLCVESIMTPIEDVVSVNVDDFNDSAMKEMISSKYSRIPVYAKNKDQILGILFVKDILEHVYFHTDQVFSLVENLRTPIVVEKGMLINQVFAKMKQEQFHFAIVKDQEQVMGIITLEDIIEEIMGDIYDEHDIT
jgi:putative hemolysin